MSSILNATNGERAPVALFRVDGGAGIGNGHLTRTLALAECLIKRGWECHLLTGELIPVLDMWRGAGAQVHLISNDGDLEESIAQARGADWVVLDGYHFGRQHWKAFKKAAGHVLAFDDMATHMLEVDIVVNQNPGAEQRYLKQYTLVDKALLGCQYVQLRRTILNQRKSHSNKRGILVSFGGDDRQNMALIVLELLLDAGFEGRITLVGSAPPEGMAKLRERAASHENVIVSGPTDLAPLLAGAQVAIIGAGTTALEALYIGTAAVLVSSASNQIPGAEFLNENGAARYVGDASHSIGTAVNEAMNLLKDDRCFANLVKNGQDLVDGQGAQRVAMTMEQMK